MNLQLYCAATLSTSYDLQLLAIAGDSPASPGWLEAALSALQPQLPTLEALAALLLLQSLKAFRAQPPADFMAGLQQRLLRLVHKFDAMGVATMLEGLVAAGAPPGDELQAVLAAHIKKGLARPSQVGRDISASRLLSDLC